MDGIILELKVGDTPESAIAQIKEKKYTERFMRRISGRKEKPCRILLVGISYNKEKKEHRCKVEEMRLEE